MKREKGRIKGGEAPLDPLRGYRYAYPLRPPLGNHYKWTTAGGLRVRYTYPFGVRYTYPFGGLRG